ncbi:MAG: transcription factor [Candidatus Caldarchaeum sp.]|nr:transcription factor [Candidatus Caldarchaeum sp.]
MKIVRMIGGEEAVKIVRLLLDHPGKTDEEISAETSYDIKDVRRVLHKLNEVGAVSYEVHRDKDTGHRIFKWKVQQEQLIGYSKTLIRKVLERLKARLEYENSNQMYWCGTNGCSKYSFEQAMEQLFRCKMCKKPLTIYDNSKFVENLRKKIAELEAMV